MRSKLLFVLLAAALAGCQSPVQQFAKSVQGPMQIAVTDAETGTKPTTQDIDTMNTGLQLVNDAANGATQPSTAP